MVRDRFSGCFDFALSRGAGSASAQHDRGFEFFCLMNQF